MPKFTVASFNIEWMNHWFGTDSAPAAWRAKTAEGADVPMIARRAAKVIEAIRPNLLAIQEGPSRIDEMELFVNDYLGGNYAVLGGTSGGQQRPYVLYAASTVTSAALVSSSELSMLLDPWMVDVDGDAVPNEYAFARAPLVVDATLGGVPLELIVLHTKSNFVNNGEKLWKNLATRQQYVVEALKSRRRISAECMRVREYVDARLDQDPDARIVLLGDLNDGPGRDKFEREYLTHSVTDIAIGTAFEPEKQLRHAQHDAVADERYTCVFNDFVTGEKNRKILLDHILVSRGLYEKKGLRVVKGSGRVCHAEWQDQVVREGRKRQDRPSDHRPVAIDLRT